MNWSIIKEILTSDFGSFAFIGGILFAIISGAYKIGQIKNAFEAHKKDLDKMQGHTEDLISVKAEHNILEKRFDKVESKLNKIDDSMSLLKIMLNSLTSKNDMMTQTNSPLTLTTIGKQIIEEYKITEMINDNWSNILEYSKQIESKNPYDIQQFFIEETILRLDKILGKENEDKIKFISFEKGIPLASIAKAIAVVIRDRYFQEHDILISDIDKHDPMQQNTNIISS